MKIKYASKNRLRKRKLKYNSFHNPPLFHFNTQEHRTENGKVHLTKVHHFIDEKNRLKDGK